MRNFLYLLTFLLVGLTTHLNAQPLEVTLQNPASANCGDEFRIDVHVKDYTNLFSAQFSINWDETILIFDRVDNVHEDFDGFNAPGFGLPGSSLNEDSELSFAWFDSSQPNGLTIAEDEILFSIYYNFSNSGGSSTLIEVTDVPTFREANNSSFINVGVTQNNSSASIVDDTPPTISCPPNQSLTIPANDNSSLVHNIDPTMSDNCGVDGLMYTLTGATVDSGDDSASGQSFNVGTTTVIYTVMDASNNSNDCSFEITLNNQPTADLDLIVNTEAVSCGGQTFSIDIDVRDFNELLGVQFSINWDASGLNYQDVVPTGALTGFLDFDENQVNDGILTLSWFDSSNNEGLTLADNTTIFSIEFSAVGGSGVTDINITGEPMPIEIIDKDNNVSTNVDVQNGQVFLSDDLDPELTCPGNVTATVSQGQTSTIVNNIAPIASDNCGIASLTYELSNETTGSGSNSADGNAFNLGLTTVTYTATDNSGNSTTCDFEVTVMDDSPLHLFVSADDVECVDGAYVIDIDVQHFTNISGLQFSINWDHTVFDFENTSDLLLQPNGNFTMDETLLDNGILTFSWFDNTNQNGVTLLDGTTIFSVHFSVVGMANSSAISITNNTLEIEATSVMNNNPMPIDVTVDGTTVSVSDDEAPMVTCRDITRNLSIAGMLAITAEEVEMSSSDNCSTTLTKSISRSNFSCVNLGPNTVTLTVEDASGNESTCTAIVTITDTNNSCDGAFNPIIGDLNLLVELFGTNTMFPPGISDPCVCRNNVPDIENGETSDAGLFSDEILIVSENDDDQWQVVGASNDQPLPYHFEADLSLQAADLTRVMPGNQFTLIGSFDDNGQTYYTYSLEIIHRDNEGYSIEVEEANGRYPNTEQISNLCFYPDPIIENIRGAYSTQCSGAVSINGAEMNGVLPDNYTLRLDGPDPSLPIVVSGVDCQNPSVNCNSAVLTFVPADLNLGNYTATFMFDAGIAGMEDTDLVGCQETVVANFEIVNPPVQLLCNTNLQVSLNELCEGILTPDAILEGDQDNYDLFEVEVMNQFGQPIGHIVDASHIGQTLMVSVTDVCSENFCMGSIRVEDKFAPRFECDGALTVACTADLNAIAPPVVADNCDISVTPVLVNETYETLDCSDGLVARMVRTWSATDDYGNVSNNCNQVINIQKFTLDDVVFPPHYDNNEEPALSCVNANTDPSNTGFPTINNGPIDGGDVCRMVANSKDQIVNTCGNSYKILRTWTVYDWCIPIETGINPIEYVQFIKVEDATPAEITCPPTLTVGAANTNCSANVTLPAATVNDLCSNTSVRIATPFELIYGNGGEVTLPLGLYTVTYTATDDCDNESSCETVVQVIDNIEPVAVCDQTTVVTLNSTGIVEANAISFDDGSYDNCTAVTFLVRRMDGDGVFADAVAFDCSDIPNNPIQVIFQVSDANGNQNSCMVLVEVQDDNSPSLTCPADITIDCTQDPLDLDLTGQASLSDVCDLTTLTFDDTNDINDCGQGTVTRTFRARDSQGNESNCIQFITIGNIDTPFGLDDISFPQDINLINQCGVDIAPENLLSEPTNYSQPIINEAPCANIVVSYEDEWLNLSSLGDSACYKVLRTWKVIDWCQYEPNATTPVGRFEHIQVIKVLDEQAPVVDCPAELIVDITNANDCFSDAFDLPVPTFTDCSIDINIAISGDLGTSMTVSNIAPDDYNVTYTISDGCGNTSTCQTTIAVRDRSGPTGNCNSVILPMNTTGMIDVSASDLVLASSLQDNCTAPEDIILTYSMNATDTSRTFTCEDLGVNTVDVFGLDEDGNWTLLCSPTVEIENNDNCTGGLINNISGVIQNEEGYDLVNASVAISGNFSNVQMTETDGTYSFEVPHGGDYSIQPSKDVDATNGVSTFDLILISKHVLDIAPLDSPYKIIAADVNKSGSITTFDMIYIRKMILSTTDSFPNNTSWRFVRSDYVFEDASNPLSEVFPEVYNINDLREDRTDADFIAIKVGDVNNSAIPNLLSTTTERRTNSTLSLDIENQFFQKYDELIIPVTSSNFEQILGFQGGIHFDTEKLEFLDLESGLLNTDKHFGLKQIEKGILTFSWNESFERSLSKETILFYLKFKAKEKGDLADNLTMNSLLTPIEAYQKNNQTINLIDVQLNYSSVFMDEREDVVLFQNEPNPFYENTKIRFYLPISSVTNLTVSDFSGQTIWKQSENLEKGYHEIDINTVKQKGIFYFKLETSGAILTRKMVKLN